MAKSVKRKKIIKDKPNLILKLPVALDIAAAEGLYQLIVENLDYENDLIVDVGEIECISTPCIQILVSASNALSIKGLRLRVKNKNDEFSEKMTLLGLNDELLKWSAA